MKNTGRMSAAFALMLVLMLCLSAAASAQTSCKYGTDESPCDIGWYVDTEAQQHCRACFNHIEDKEDIYSYVEVTEWEDCTLDDGGECAVCGWDYVKDVDDDEYREAYMTEILYMSMAAGLDPVEMSASGAEMSICFTDAYFDELYAMGVYPPESMYSDTTYTLTLKDGGTYDYTGSEITPAVLDVSSYGPGSWLQELGTLTVGAIEYKNNTEPGTATASVEFSFWDSYEETISLDFTIVSDACAHPEFKDGVCTACGYACEHSNYVDGECEDCGKSCPHDSFVYEEHCDEYLCEDCGMPCGHESYEDGKCGACGMLQMKITSQPTSKTVATGTTATTSILAQGDGLSYAWYYKLPTGDDFVKASVTGAGYSLKMTTARSGVKVYCTVTDTYGNSVTSDVVTFKAKTPLKITSQPSSKTVLYSTTVATSVKAQGEGLKYAWYYKLPTSDSFVKASVTGATYSVKMTTARSGIQVYCKVTDKYGESVTSNTVTLKGMTELKFTTQPTNKTVATGTTASTTVKASGDGVTYSWYYKLPASDSFVKASVTGSTYSLKMTAARSGVKVYCRAKDEHGNYVKSNTVTFTAKTPLEITAQPSNKSVTTGETASTSIKASGDGLSYAWYYKLPTSDSFIKASVTGSTYSLKMTQSRSGIQVYCKVRDKHGETVTSRTVTFTAKPALTITGQPSSKSAAIGQTVSTSVSATGEGLSYAWYYKLPTSSSYVKASVTGNTYSIKMTTARDGIKVYCNVSDSYGQSVKSNTVTFSAE